MLIQCQVLVSTQELSVIHRIFTNSTLIHTEWHLVWECLGPVLVNMVQVPILQVILQVLLHPIPMLCIHNTTLRLLHLKERNKLARVSVLVLNASLSISM